MAKKVAKPMEIPRGKLIGQNGPGSLYIDTEGISYVISAADKWFSTNQRLNLKKLEIREPRLERLLKVKNFREVPQYVSPYGQENKENTAISVPIQRFPLAHYCTKCGYFKDFYPVNSLKTSYCSHCEKDTVFTQFPIIVVCSAGHMMDFPYYRYAHIKSSSDSASNHSVRLIREGSSILSWSVKCDCGAMHSLAGVTGQSSSEGMTPYQKEMGGHAKCFGNKPWTGEKNTQECECNPTAILRNSISNYSAETISALSISTDDNSISADYEDIKSDEFSRLTLKTKEDKLDVRNSFSAENTIIKNVNYVFRLEEIVVQVGFHRLSVSDEAQNWNKISQNQIGNILFSNEIKIPEWYPAKKQYGEGVFIEFNTELLEAWTKEKGVMKRQYNLLNRVGDFYMADNFSSPIKVMIHTFSHALIHQFSLTSGYPITAIREKIYASNDEIGLLLYVTDSDKDGTFGGLVRLAEESKFKSNVNEALRRLDWCSSDPVCFELGENFGQGIHNSNGSACHNCSYIPDTACSYRNSFLDRDYIGRKESEISVTNFANIF